jgi:uncharacterized NAD(P)/FAD-binding protein YdhS
MAIGSAAPIGESFTRLNIVNGFIDQEQYSNWAKWFKSRVEKDGLLFDEAKVMYPPREVVGALVAEIKMEVEQARVLSHSYKV